MKTKIITGHAARIGLSGVGKCGGAVARQRRTQLGVNSKSTLGAKKKEKTMIKLKL